MADPVIKQHSEFMIQVGEEHLAIYSGTVEVNVEGVSTSRWHNERVEFSLPHIIKDDEYYDWKHVRTVAPSVSLASIENRGRANNAGWAVSYAEFDGLSYPNGTGRVQIKCMLKVRDTDGVLNRLSYHVAVVGTPRIAPEP